MSKTNLQKDDLKSIKSNNIKKKSAMNIHKNSDIQNENNILSNEIKWYIVQTYSGFEEAVKKNLELKIEKLSLQDKIREIYIPTRKVTKLSSKGERKEIIERIYPGYIYIKMLLDNQTGYVIQNTNYVSRLTGTGEIAVPLSDNYVEKLKASLLDQSKTQKETKISNFKVGDLVRVTEGPFKDMPGKISQVDETNNTIDVWLTMFERETLVTLDILAVKKEI